MLDGYDISLLGWPPEHPLHQQALQILNERNPQSGKLLILLIITHTVKDRADPPSWLRTPNMTAAWSHHCCWVCEMLHVGPVFKIVDPILGLQMILSGKGSSSLAVILTAWSWP